MGTCELGQECCPDPAPLAHHKRALTLGGHEEVHTLQHVQEELIPAVLDALPPPADLPSHLAGDLRLLFLCLHGVTEKNTNGLIPLHLQRPCLYPHSTLTPPPFFPSPHAANNSSSP